MMTRAMELSATLQMVIDVMVILFFAVLVTRGSQRLRVGEPQEDRDHGEAAKD